MNPELPSALNAEAADIRSCYRLLLGREPDEEGLATWISYLAEHSLSTQELAQRFLDSAEFRMRHSTIYGASMPATYVSVGPWNVFRRHASSAEDPAAAFAEAVRKIAAEQPPPSIETTEFGGEGLTLVFPKGDFTWQALIEHGQYEPWVSSEIDHYVPAGGIMIDVGCNIGYFSIAAARRAGPQGRVLAIDGATENARLCWLNCRLNHVDSVVQVYPVSVSDRIETLVYEIGEGASNFQMNPLRADGTEVKPMGLSLALPLDHIAGDLRRLDLLKLDIEGFEGKCLHGAKKILKRFHPVLISEYSPILIERYSGLSGPELLREIRELGYRVYAMLQDGPRQEGGGDIQHVHAVYEEHHQKHGASHIDILCLPS